MFTHKRFGNSFAVGLLLACSSVAGAQEREGISDDALTELTSRAMSEFSVPGMAVGSGCTRRLRFQGPGFFKDKVMDVFTPVGFTPEQQI